MEPSPSAPTTAADESALGAAIVDGLPDRVAVVDRDGAVLLANRRWHEASGGDPVGPVPSLMTVLRRHLDPDQLDEWAFWRQVDEMILGVRKELHLDYSTVEDGSTRWFTLRARPLDGPLGHIMVVVADDTDRRDRAVEALHLQKLEAVGQLAEGIAHEINTPIQFVGDNLRFLGTATGALLDLVGQYRTALDVVAGANALPVDVVEAVAGAEAAADLAFLTSEVPAAVAESLGGIERVATIVAALKAFGHPGDSEHQVGADLNAIIENTLVVARNELKYVADVETHLGELPEVACYPGDIGQVLLNLVVNAAHAMADVASTTGERGVLRIGSARHGSRVVLWVGDSGGGIAPEAQSRVFEPFFTTKEPGRGTGQGLAIAHHIVVDRHGGTLTFRTGPRGTTFEVDLPIGGNPGR